MLSWVVLGWVMVLPRAVQSQQRVIKCRQTDTKIPAGKVMNWLVQLCLGLHYLHHEAKVLHRYACPNKMHGDSLACSVSYLFCFELSMILVDGVPRKYFFGGFLFLFFSFFLFKGKKKLHHIFPGISRLRTYSLKARRSNLGILGLQSKFNQVNCVEHNVGQHWFPALFGIGAWLVACVGHCGDTGWNSFQLQSPEGQKCWKIQISLPNVVFFAPAQFNHPTEFCPRSCVQSAVRF